MRLLPYFLLASILTFGQEKSRKDIQKDSITFYLNNARGSIKNSYLKKALSLSKSFGNDSLLKRSSIEFGLDSYFKRDLLGLSEANKSLTYLFQKNQDSFALAKIHHFKALIFRIQNRLDSSFHYYFKSKETSIAIKDSLEVGRRLLSMSNMQKDGKDYLGAEASIIEGLRYLESLNEIRFTANSYNSLGNILLKKLQFEESRKYYWKSLDIVENDSSEKRQEGLRLMITNNIGNSYLIEERYREALPFFEKSLERRDIRKKFPYYYELLLGNYSDTKYFLGDKEEALEGLNMLYKARKKRKNYFGMSLSHNGYADYFTREGDRKKALFHALEGYKLTKRINNNYTRASLLIKLANLTSGNESKKYMNEYVALNDSLRNIELNLKSNFTKIRYETEKKEQENKTLKIDNDRKAAEVQKAKQQRIIGWLVAIALFLILGLSVTFYRNRRKKLLYESQLEKANAREHERQQIAKSLHDEVAGDLRMLHQKLTGSDQKEEADGLEKIKENVRNLSHQLSSVSFEEVSFKDQMINLATDYFSKDFKVFMKGLDNDDWNTVNETIKRTLYLSVRESIQNAIKYAKANRFDVLFALEKKQVTVIAKDDGVGFTAEKGSKGIGLKNMEERVQELRGQLNIKSSEKGTVIEISIPQNGK
ncbi:tetratricopeptide repeat protein [Flavobacteriaceae bacterium S356]|uniref:histidine kinase n=1 Tax=Asprobacillus argus TaxID=3076534 RepID=A0ABU3LDA3_9FLAO|nr:tetratricopeptide repeat protein [Flavobacteriaceae bacterium S356]